MESAALRLADQQNGAVLDERSPTELSLVEIAERLESITRAIEAERSRERDARKVYQSVATESREKISRIRRYARALLDEQARRAASFNGMLEPAQAERINGDGKGPAAQVGDGGEGVGIGEGVEGDGGGARGTIREPKPHRRRRGGRLTLPEAIEMIWGEEGGATRPLSTEEIIAALERIGYATRASERSLKTTINQSLAKLSREGRLRKFRIDGTEITSDDTRARARKYMLV